MTFNEYHELKEIYINSLKVLYEANTTTQRMVLTKMRIDLNNDIKSNVTQIISQQPNAQKVEPSHILSDSNVQFNLKIYILAISQELQKSHHNVTNWIVISKLFLTNFKKDAMLYSDGCHFLTTDLLLKVIHYTLVSLISNTPLRASINMELGDIRDSILILQSIEKLLSNEKSVDVFPEDINLVLKILNKFASIYDNSEELATPIGVSPVALQLAIEFLASSKLLTII
ncbi:MAG: hypothetical protein ATN35_13405 [Epulopiscium sp. Nele67-Bin004]|nr:MAG: hypothetical protein ATN35_13405 [Epulopiscium sp. Nele67-Bin004]